MMPIKKQDRVQGKTNRVLMSDGQELQLEYQRQKSKRGTDGPTNQQTDRQSDL